MEVYLKDRLIEELKKDSMNIEKFIKNYQFSHKITVEDVIAGPVNLVKTALNNIVFHNIKKIDALYQVVFDISILKLCEYKSLDYILQIRHKLIHNNGIVGTKKIRITPISFVMKCEEISNFIEAIDYFIRYGKKRKKFPRLYNKNTEKFEKLYKWEGYSAAVWSNADLFDKPPYKQIDEEFLNV